MARHVRDVLERLNVQRFVLYGMAPSKETSRAFVRAGYALSFVLPRVEPISSAQTPLPHFDSVDAAMQASTTLAWSWIQNDSSWRELQPPRAAVPASCAVIITDTATSATDSVSSNDDDAWGLVAHSTRVAYRSGAHVLCVGDVAHRRLTAALAAHAASDTLARNDSTGGSHVTDMPDLQSFDMTWDAFVAAALGGGDGSLKFGPHDIHRSQVCYANRHVIVLTNLKPVLPGHLLCITRRRVPRFAQLTADEVTCLWLTAQRVGDILSRATHAHGLTIAVQDGAAAGQTVPHVHVHILPRSSGDIPHNDAVYDMIDDSERAQAGRHAHAVPHTAMALDPLPRRASSTSVHEAAAGTPLALGDTPPPAGVETAQLHAVVRATSHAAPHHHVVASSERPGTSAAGGDERKPRSMEDMAREAQVYRPLMRDEWSDAWIEV